MSKETSGAKPKDFPEFKQSFEQGSEEVWSEATFQDAKPVYVGHPDIMPKHLQDLD